MIPRILCAVLVGVSWAAAGMTAERTADDGAAADGAGAAYTAADFAQVRKFDAHGHANTGDHRFLDIAAKDGFEILSINVDYPDFPSLARQARVVHALQAADPRRFHFATTFSMKGFGGAAWTANAIRHIDAEMARGALGVKVWKNIGMVERDAQGRLIMLDDRRFDGVMNHLEAKGIPLVAHQAEPKNCWLPLEAMTTENDRSYFRDHPEYHMYLHPEQPSYDKSDPDKVRRFFVKYQDRLLYGSDLTEDPPEPHARAQNPPMDPVQFAVEADAFWRSDWVYLATSEVQPIDAIKAEVKGLALPKPVIDKIYYANARRVFGLPPR
jgi:hypothetical protein